uniref:39S ribosomal protein L52, mitochondrial n=1 Tax=Heterorhabditis bacteriophora TaxID=37862 RepID=A0A1I7WFU2_HETBA
MPSTLRFTTVTNREVSQFRIRQSPSSQTGSLVSGFIRKSVPNSHNHFQRMMKTQPRVVLELQKEELKEQENKVAAKIAALKEVLIKKAAKKKAMQDKVIIYFCFFLFYFDHCLYI